MEWADDSDKEALLLRLQELENENAMLKGLLDEHGISYSIPTAVNISSSRPNLAYKNKFLYFKTCSVAEMMFSQGAGIVPRLRRLGISQGVIENGIVSIVTNENTSVQNVLTGSSPICRTTISSIILPERILLAAMSLASIQFARITHATSYALTLMIRAASMAIRMMFLLS